MATRKKAASKAKAKPKGSPKKRAVKAKTRVKANPEAEYAATMKKQGVATISQLSNDEALPNIRGRISTQSLALDALLRNPREPVGWRGIPLSRVTEIFGPPFIGKSTLLDLIFGSVQKDGGTAILADTETSRDRHYVNRLGVDLDRLQYMEFVDGVVHIENVIKAFIHTIEWWKANYPDQKVVIGWDALGSTATKDSWDKGVEFDKANQPGAAARAMNEASRHLPPRLAGTNIALVIINHEYEMIRTGMAAKFGGKKRETYGGHGVRHADSLRIKLYSAGTYIKDAAGRMLGRVVAAELIKNRLGESSVTAHVPIMQGIGVDNVWTVLEDLKKEKIVVTNGSWSAINIDGQQINFQGWAGLKLKCVEDESLFPRLLSVWNQVTGNAPLHVPVSEVSDD